MSIEIDVPPDGGYARPGPKLMRGN
jgi:hypothetical protein